MSEWVGYGLVVAVAAAAQVYDVAGSSRPGTVLSVSVLGVRRPAAVEATQCTGARALRPLARGGRTRTAAANV